MERKCGWVIGNDSKGPEAVWRAVGGVGPYEEK